MSKIKIDIWDREFDIAVVYECYQGEEILESQKNAFDMFADAANEIAKSLPAIIQYVRKTHNGNLEDEAIDNIFKYVMPKNIFVPHSDKHHTVAIMCNYKFDAEHGIAVVFEKGKFKKVTSQDTVL